MSLSLFKLSVFTILLACSHQKNFREVASLEGKTNKIIELKIFSGPSMPGKQVVATSLPKIPLSVRILSKDPDIVCLDDQNNVLTDKAVLPADLSAQKQIICNLDHDGSEYPRAQNIKLEYEFDHQHLNIPDDFDDYIDELKAFSLKLDESESWNAGMQSLITKTLSERKVDIDIMSNKPTKISLADKGFYFDLARFEAKMTVKSFLGSKKLELTGQLTKEKNKANLTYGNFPHGALVCGIGLTEDGLIKQVVASAGSLMTFINAKAPVYCQINHMKAKPKLKIQGYLTAYLKEKSFIKIKEEFEQYIANEDLLIKQKINSLLSEQISSFNEKIAQLIKNNDVNNDAMKGTIASINRQKFLNKKQEIIKKLFPSEAKEKFGKSFVRFKFNPVIKKVFYPDGKIEEQVYVKITNNIGYKLENLSFREFSLEKETSYLDGVNIYIQAKDKWDHANAPKPFTLLVCENNISKFEKSLNQYYQKKSLSYSELSSHFNAINEALVDCRLKEVNKDLITLAKTEEYSIDWTLSEDKGEYQIMKALFVANMYKGRLLDSDVKMRLLRDNKFSHPAFDKDSAKSIKKGAWDKYIISPNLYTVPYNDETFITLD